MKWFAALLLPLTVLLVGCPTKIVYLPVYKCDEPPEMRMPLLLTKMMRREAPTEEKLQALGMDHLRLKNSLEQCIIYLDAYRGKK